MATANKSREVLREYLTVILMEGKWEDLKVRADAKGWGDYSATFMDYKAAGINPKYADLFWKQYVYTGGNPLPDPRTTKPVLDRFEELTKIKTPEFEPDVTKYEHFYDLASTVEAFSDVKSKTKAKKVASQGTKVVYTDKDWSLLEVHSKDAACTYGTGTKWCISATKSQNLFDQYYSKFSDFWFLIHKSSGEKWAITHLPTGKIQVFDSSDTEIGLEEMKASIGYILKGAPPPEGLAAALQRVAGLTVNDRIVANPGRVLKPLGPRLDSRTAIQLAVQNPPGLTQDHLNHLLLRLSQIDSNEYKELLTPETMEAMRRFLRSTSFTDMELVNLTMEDLDAAEDGVLLKNPNLSDEEFRAGLKRIAPTGYYFLPRDAINRTAEVLSRIGARGLSAQEESGLWSILRQGKLDPSQIPPETFLNLADTTKFPYDFREAVASTLIPWLKGPNNQLLNQILGGSVKVEEFMASAPSVEAGWRGLGHSDLPKWELARDLQQNGMDPIRVALKRITETFPA